MFWAPLNAFGAYHHFKNFIGAFKYVNLKKIHFANFNYVLKTKTGHISLRCLLIALPSTP